MHCNKISEKKKNGTVKQSHNPIITCSQKKIQADKVKYSLKIIRHQKVSQKKFIIISNKKTF